jgi:hypothetical protein
MSVPSEPPKLSEPVKEPSLFPAVPFDRDELPYRLRQQSLLGEFGRFAMQTRDFRQILQRATELRAQGLEARFAKVLESAGREASDGARRRGLGAGHHR